MCAAALAGRLGAELRRLRQQPVEGFHVEQRDGDSPFVWTVHFLGAGFFKGGVYKAELAFPHDGAAGECYPFAPPTLRVLSSFVHPNVYPPETGGAHRAGEVCMSLLHAPGRDALNALESASVRWSCACSVSVILLSFVTLMSDPDPKEGSPANVTALSLFRESRLQFVEIAQRNARKSLEELSDDFVFPSHFGEPPKAWLRLKERRALERQQNQYQNQNQPKTETGQEDEGEQSAGTRSAIRRSRSPVEQQQQQQQRKPENEKREVVEIDEEGDEEIERAKQRYVAEVRAKWAAALAQLHSFCAPAPPPCSDERLIALLERCHGRVEQVASAMWD